MNTHSNELDIAHSSAVDEIRRRLPWMGLALAAALVMVFLGKQFEEGLSRRIELVFFIPVMVYLSDCIGTETLALFVRELARHEVRARRLFARESIVGLALGLACGLPLGLFAYAWMGDARLAAAIALAMTVNGLVAVLTGMAVPVAFSRLGRDPAIGTDELTTAISDNASMVIYLVVAALIVFPAT